MTRARVMLQPWVAYLVVSVAVSLLFLTDSPVVRSITFCALVTAPLAALGFQVLHRQPPLSGPWRLLLVGFTIYAAASFPWYLLPVNGHPLPFPSLVDAGLFASYAVFAATLVSFARRHRDYDGRASLEVLIVALGVGTPLWEFLLKPHVIDESWLDTAALYTYPLTLLLLLGLTIRLAVLVDRPGPALLFLIGWIMGELAGDTYYAVSVSNDSFQLDSPYLMFFLASYVCLGTAVLHPGARGLSEVRPARVLSPAVRLVLLGSAAVTPLVVAALRMRDDSSPPVYLLLVAGVLAMLLLTRVSSLMVDLSTQRRVRLELERLTRDLSYRASHDALTDLPNRTLFNERLDQALATASTTVDRGVAVLMLDLDGFKEVNDTLGHDAGDGVLITVAERLDRTCRSGDILARLGGDEFALLLSDVDLAQATAAAEGMLAALRNPLHEETRALVVTGTVGIALSDGSQDRSLLLKQADVAMLDAKARPGSYRVFSAEIHTAVLARHALSTDLKSAVVSGELRLEYQPVMDLTTHRMVGVEALVRWAHPVHGLVPPLQFIPLAEANGCIGEIGNWVLEEACRQSRRWDRAHPSHPPLDIAVNLSPRELDSGDVIERIEDVLRRTGVDPRRIVLEITESALAEDTEGMIPKLVRLKSLGVQLALDDFGTGFSSLSVLRRLPLDIIKIDRAFVAGIAREPEEWAVTTAIIALAISLGKRTLAEGIELGEQLAHLRALQCELGQGYLFDRPLPPEGIDERLAAASQPVHA